MKTALLRWIWMGGVGVYALLSAPLAQATAVTFSQDVFPIVQAHCQVCHQRGEIAPMAFTSYQDTRPWARSIRQAVLTRAMPPWHAEPGSVHFGNDRSLSQHDLDTLVAWVDGGAPEGPSRVYPAPEHPPSGWKLGKPDLVIPLPEFSVPAQGDVPYTFLVVPTGLKEDTWVQAVEFNVEQRSVVHHMNAFARGPGSSYVAGYEPLKYFVPTKKDRVIPREGERSFDRRQLLLGYEPGYQPVSWEPGQAKLIKAGSDIVFELHYTPNGKPTVDHSRLGLSFAAAPPAQRVLAIQAANESFVIPPGDPAYRSAAVITFAKNVTLISMQPHMHFRGKSMEFIATYPDNTHEVLLNVPAYDFNWQTTYFLDKPKTLPAGTRIDCIAYFDNSVNKRGNPDPTKTVRWGDQSTDEMHIGFLEVQFNATEDAEAILDSAHSQRVDIKP